MCFKTSNFLCRPRPITFCLLTQYVTNIQLPHVLSTEICFSNIPAENRDCKCKVSYWYSEGTRFKSRLGDHLS